LIIFLCLIVVKYSLYNYEYMTENERSVNIIGLGFNQNETKRIVEDINLICDVPAGTPYGMVAPKPDISTDEKNELDFKDYKLKITSGQDFHSKLDTIEQKVFLNFYGKKEWKSKYDEYLKQREKKIDKSITNMCETHVKTLAENVSKENVVDKINTLTYLENIDQQNYSTSYNSSSSKDPDLDIRKMQYRSLEEDNLQLYNYYMNWAYYLLLLTIILLLFSNSKLNITSNIFIYLFLFVLPIFIYPYVFKGGDYIIHFIFSRAEDVLPKNAFMNDD